MTDNAFKAELIQALRRQIDDTDLEVAVREVVKNNGKTLTGIGFRTSGEMVVPVIYIDSLEPMWLAGRPIDEIASELFDAYCKRLYIEPSFPDLRWEHCSSDIEIVAVNERANSAMLADIPHRTVEDLAFYARVRVPEFEEDGIATFKVTNELLQYWKKTPDEVLNLAVKNTERKEFKCESLVQMIKEMTGLEAGLPMDEVPEIPQVLVVSNSEKLHGAQILACKDSLSEIVEKVGCDVYIIPSSIHELLIVSKSEATSLDELKQMVAEVNRTALEPEDVLSDNVYTFDSKTKKLRIAGSEPVEKEKEELKKTKKQTP